MSGKLKIHVTGCRGFLGRHVMASLKDLGDVRGTDVDDLDITKKEMVLARFSSDAPDIMVHLAALKGNVPSWKNPSEFMQVNTLGTLNLLEACRQSKIGRFIFMSSATVHGKTASEVTEMSSINPLHPYGASKAAAEALIHAYANAGHIRAVSLRPNFIVGPIPAPQPYADNLIYDFIRDIEKKGVIELAGDGRFEREWVHAADVALAVRQAVVKDPGPCEAYILSTNRVSMKDLVKKIVQKMGKGEVKTNPSISGFSLISSSTKAKKELEWLPTKDLEAIVDEIWNEYNERKNSSDYRNEPRDRASSR